MTDEEVFEVAKECGIGNQFWWSPNNKSEHALIAKFGRAMAEKEREACAKVAEASAAKAGDYGRQHRDNGDDESMGRCYDRSLQCTQVAADIRTRSNAAVSGRGDGQ